MYQHKISVGENAFLDFIQFGEISFAVLWQKFHIDFIEQSKKCLLHNFDFSHYGARIKPILQHHHTLNLCHFFIDGNHLIGVQYKAVNGD